MTSRTSRDSEMKAAVSSHARDRRHSGSGFPKYYAIKAVAEALDVSPRTIRRWIAKGDLSCTALVVSSESLMPIYGRF